MQKFFLIVPIILFTILGLNSCKKNSVEEQYTETIHPVIPDLSTQIYASVSGFVTDENGNAVEAATVKAGTTTTTTDEFGYFQIANTGFAKSAGFALITKSGYFNGIKTFVPITAKESFVRVQLIPKTLTGNCSSTTGGTISTADGSTVSIPANALYVASTTVPYTGNVNAAVHWYNPADQSLLQLTMPGDLRGIDSEGYLKILTTYGMLAVELTSDAGELLQLAAGYKAALSFPIPSSLQANAPASIPLWYFNENKGLWVEDGSAIKNGNYYQGEVSHFSFWNCDIPSISLVNFTAQAIDNSLNSLLNAAVTISIAGVPNSARREYTDANGIVNAMIPANSNLLIEVGTVCNTSAYVQNITTTTADVDLGSIQVNTQSSIAFFTGIVNNCSGLPVTDGYVIISGGGVYNAVQIQNGTFSSSCIVCGNTSGYIVAVDQGATQQSAAQNTTITTGLNDFGTISACGAPTVEGITYSLDGVQTILSLPQYVFGGEFFITNDSTDISAFDPFNAITAFNLGFSSTTLPGNYVLSGNITLDQLLYILPAPTTVTITNYGVVGDFITGSTGSFQVLDMGGNPHTFSCSFNVIRDN